MTRRALTRRVVIAAIVGVSGCDRPAHDAADDLTVEEITIAAAHASNPTVALGAEGSFVAWIGGDGADDVWLARAGADGAFGAPVRVNDIPGDAAAHGQAPAQVAVGPDGAVYVLWQNNTHVEGRRFPASDLRFARSTDGGRTFEPAVYVNDDAGGPPASHTFHDLEVGPDGTVWVSWIDGRARSGSGHAHHAQGGSSSATGPDIRVARSTDGGRTFGPGTVIASDACPCCRTALAIGPDGAVYVAWRQVFDGNVRDVVVARSTDGLSFGNPVRVHADGWVFDGCPHAGPAIAVGDDGTLHAAWYTGANGGGLFHASSTDGGASFGPPHPLVEAGAVPPSQVALAAAEDGLVWLAWEGAAEGTPAVRLASVRGSAAPRPFGDAAEAGTLPQLAAQGDGFILAWLDGDAVRARVASSGTLASGPTAARDGAQAAPAYAAPELDGDSISLASLRGAPVLLNVWATWCTPCREEMPALQAVHEELRGRGLRVVGVSIDQKRADEEVRGFLVEHGVDFTILRDPAGQVSRTFGTVGVPETFLIDARGVLRRRWIGPVTADDVRAAVLPLLPPRPGAA